ncbi:hypothetical protein [Pseudonocardia sp. NPDC049635]|uniref:hypothetical protein n=1 Tax=Pseudonocardia sp. NPDC049635 TaxID=3155506 RepID=UPI0033C1692F
MKNTPLSARKDRDWMDEVAVELYLDGKNPGRSLTLAERQEVARRKHEKWIETTARALRVKPHVVRAAVTTTGEDPAQLTAA